MIKKKACYFWAVFPSLFRGLASRNVSEGIPTVSAPEIQSPSISYQWHTHILFLIPLTAVISYVGVAHGFWGASPKAWYDTHRDFYPLATTIIRFISDYSAVALYAVYLAIFLRSLKHQDTNGMRFIMRFVLGTLLITAGLTYLVKAGIGMPRPGFPLPQQPFSFEKAYSSFPSGHTAEIIGAALPLAFWLKKKRWQVLLAVLVGIVGYSRLWLGAHHPVDIYGGMVMGSVVARFIYMPTTDARRTCAKSYASLPPTTNG